MTPAARVAAAIGVLDDCLSGMPVEKALLRWSRASRFAGSKDRAAVRDHVFDGWRRRRSAAHAGGAETGRGIMIGLLRQHGVEPETLFTGRDHAPVSLDADEMHLSTEPAAPAVAHDLPDWLWDCFLEDLGEAGPDAAQALRDRAPVFLRVNPRRGDQAAAIASLAADGVEAVAHPDVAGALRVVSGGRAVARSRAYADGLVELQDAASQAAMLRLPLRDGQRVLDFCAGGGGKALALAARARIEVAAHDANPTRMRDIPARAERAGVRIDVIERVGKRRPISCWSTRPVPAAAPAARPRRQMAARPGGAGGAGRPAGRNSRSGGGVGGRRWRPRLRDLFGAARRERRAGRGIPASQSRLAAGRSRPMAAWARRRRVLPRAVRTNPHLALYRALGILAPSGCIGIRGG